MEDRDLRTLLEHPAFIELRQMGEPGVFLLLMTDPGGGIWTSQGTLDEIAQSAYGALPLRG